MSSTVLLAPAVNRQHSQDGVPLAGYRLNAYQPGTFTPASIYSGVGGTVLSQPVLLDAWGFPSSPIFLFRGDVVDLQLSTPVGITVRTWESVSAGGNANVSAVTEWGSVQYDANPWANSGTTLNIAVSPSFINEFAPGRRVRVFGTVFSYGTVTAAATNQITFPTPGDLVVTIALDASMTSPEFGAIIYAQAAFLKPRENVIPGRRIGNTSTKFLGDVTVRLTRGLNLWPAGTVTRTINSGMTGYLECDGAAVSRTTYAALFAAIGTTFGVGDGSTTFNLPTRAPDGSLSWFIYAKA